LPSWQKIRKGAGGKRTKTVGSPQHKIAKSSSRSGKLRKRRQPREPTLCPHTEKTAGKREKKNKKTRRNRELFGIVSWNTRRSKYLGDALASRGKSEAEVGDLRVQENTLCQTLGVQGREVARHPARSEEETSDVRRPRTSG